jgi:amino-acid N-acetyltransferase
LRHGLRAGVRVARRAGAPQESGLSVSTATITAGPNLSAAIALLSSAGLPTEDLTQQHCDGFFYIGPAAALQGLVGLELFGDVALLRSLAVATGLRDTGAGSRLLAHAEDHARTRGVKHLYLLTTTAERFFARRGYTRVDHGQAPPAIRATREFSGICPASSAFMRKQLQG